MRKITAEDISREEVDDIVFFHVYRSSLPREWWPYFDYLITEMVRTNRRFPPRTLIQDPEDDIHSNDMRRSRNKRRVVEYNRNPNGQKHMPDEEIVPEVVVPEEEEVSPAKEVEETEAA